MNLYPNNTSTETILRFFLRVLTLEKKAFSSSYDTQNVYALSKNTEQEATD